MKDRRKKSKRQRSLSFKELQGYGKLTVKTMLDATGLTIEQFAFHCNVGKTKVSSWLKDPRTMKIEELIIFVDVVNKLQPNMKCKYENLFDAIIINE